MKTLTFLFFLSILTFTQFTVKAQSDTAIASQRALIFADSLVKAFRFSNWDQYLSMSYPGVIRYYGGKESFREYIQRTRSLNKELIEEKPETIKIIQISNDIREWQCVIEKVRETYIDGKKASVVSYMVGQSKDEGINWQFFDVAYNSVENVIYIMPDIFDSLAIPQRKTLYEKDIAMVERENASPVSHRTGKKSSKHK